MFVVTWIDRDDINVRIYSKKEYADKLIDWCRTCKLEYNLTEEVEDREIVNYRKPTQKMLKVVENLRTYGFINNRDFNFSQGDFKYCSEIIGKHQKRMHERFEELTEFDNLFKEERRCHYEHDMIYN